MKLYLGNKGDTELEFEDDDIIHVRPLAKCTGGVWHVKSKQAFRTEIWDGFTKKMQYVYYKAKTRYDSCMKYDTYEKAKEAANEYYMTQNKVWKNTDIQVKAKDLTRKIMKDYRFIQPSIEYEEQPVPINPYFLGIWLGDGTSSNTGVTNIDQELIDYIANLAKKYNMRVSLDDRGMTHRICCNKGGSNQLLNDLRSLDLINNKHIPECYMKNSRAVRLQVIAGLIDTDGHLNYNTYEVTQKSDTIAKQLVELGMSLGIYTESREKYGYAANTVEKRKERYNRVYLHIPSMECVPPVLIPRKKWKIPKLDYGICMSLTPTPDFRKQWTREMKIDLIVTVSNYVKLNGQIPWKTIVDYEPQYSKFNPETLRGHYKVFAQQLSENEAE